ncbi:MAG: DEAD/DEAH box helicase family protein [Solobacterium sp.]|nr:DEAD/DEAH box helicase family protein [Solobacterium sp.]
MSFLDIDIKGKYRSSDTPNIGKSFIEKMLLESVSYKRAVGFFSSSSLIYTSKGLLNVAEKYSAGMDPVIKLIVSPRLTIEDVTAIKKGYATRQEIIEKSLLSALDDPDDKFGKERLNILCHLISSGAMDIKVAITCFSEDDIGMYHEKIGIFEDSLGNKVAFEGSLNESANAFNNNFEQIRVFKSWDKSTSFVYDVESDFDEMWANQTNKIEVFQFPEVVKKKLFKYKKETYNRNIEKDEEEFRRKNEIDLPRIDKERTPTFPYKYQGDAINKWLSERCVGIFDMATGTGKTFTGFGAMVTLLQRTKYHLATVIIAPYTHLVEQWLDDAALFHINHMIVGYSSKQYAGYLSELKSSVLQFNAGTLPFFYFITTYASYKLPKVQEVLKEIKGPALLVADEAHNFGTEAMVDYMLYNFNFRLALSATVERYRDEEGTRRIFGYFGKKCIEYPLERAIREDKLTPYEYHPIIVYLDEDEREEYLRLTKLISKCINKEGKMNETGERYALQRARLIAGARGKVTELLEVIRPYADRKDHYMLIYCGTSKINKGTEGETKQIDEVTSLLYSQYGMKVSRYTSRESTEERRVLKNRFKDGNDLQALVAIKCLDEGVNIPGIRTAFILASSTNPREYIQRRGRVLRTAKGKKKAVIYDFITLPLPPTELIDSTESSKSYKALIKNETARMAEFGKYSMNPDESDLLADQIKEDYGLYDFDIDELAEIQWNEEE